MRWVGGSDNDDDVAGFNDSPGTQCVTHLDDSFVPPPYHSPVPAVHCEHSPPPVSHRTTAPSMTVDNNHSLLPAINLNGSQSPSLTPYISWTPSPRTHRGQSPFRSAASVFDDTHEVDSEAEGNN
ncbi:hypothetical protein BDQ17DRAFT_1432755 [Cyathus striatus]|nr:hypothetical protein BDQ17DRAFT_1432755 [Cyathus striatus]